MNIELVKSYKIEGSESLNNREKEIILLLTSYQLVSGLQGNRLINQIIDIMHPITVGKEHENYNAEIVRRCKQRKRLKQLYSTHLEH